MPFVIEQVEPTFSTEKNQRESDPVFGLVLIGLFILYLAKDVLFSVLKIGLIAFFSFILIKSIT